MITQEIQDLYSYTAEEQNMFQFANDYMNKVSKLLPDLLETKAGRERFILAGLFLTYRTYNHAGLPMSTEVFYESGGIHRERLSKVKDYTGKGFEDTKDYLRLLSLSSLKALFWRRKINTFLIKFVTKKRNLVWH